MGLFNALVSRSFLPWNRTNRETDYESVLSGLNHDITDVETRLAQIRRRQRRASVTLTLQAALLWAVYTGVCWLLGLLTWPKTAGATTLLVWMPVLCSPLLIFGTRRIVKWWYRRIGAAEDKHLIDLRRQKRNKIDELKRATKYDHLRMLLDKYDDNAPASASANTTPVKARASMTPNGKPSAQTPQKEAVASNIHPSPASTMSDAQRMAMMRQASAVAPMRPVQAAALPKTWMDKVADAVLGADPGAVGPEQKYALICAKCHAHNGLALREEFSEVQYVCPHCGQFNSRRPSSAPIGSPFQQPGSRLRAAPETPSKSSTIAHSTSSSKLKLRADEDDDEDKPPVASLQDESSPQDASTDSASSTRDTRLKSLRARKSHPKTSDSMDLDD